MNKLFAVLFSVVLLVIFAAPVNAAVSKKNSIKQHVLEVINFPAICLVRRYPSPNPNMNPHGVK